MNCIGIFGCDNDAIKEHECPYQIAVNDSTRPCTCCDTCKAACEITIPSKEELPLIKKQLKLNDLHRHLLNAGFFATLHSKSIVGGEDYSGNDRDGVLGCFTGYTFTVEFGNDDGFKARVLGLGQTDSGTEIVGTHPKVIAEAIAAIIRAQRTIR